MLGEGFSAGESYARRAGKHVRAVRDLAESYREEP